MHLAAAAFLFLALSPGGGEVRWETDYVKGLDRAKKQGLPLLLYFAADW